MSAYRRIIAVGLAALVVGGTAGCRAESERGKVLVVASFYPLAWAAQRIGGDRVDVEDLTPPGGEAHDSVMTAAQRGELQDAELVLILGQLGFQPDVERAAREVPGLVVNATQGVFLRGSDGGVDPHVWLDPVLMGRIVTRVAEGLRSVVARESFAVQTRGTLSALDALDAEFEAGLAACRYRTFVVSHEAFWYLADRYGLTEMGLESLSPESEPSADRIQAAIGAIRAGRAAPAVFYEPTDEGRRIGESLASDIGVAALPLSTLESAPPSGSYLTAMQENLAVLERGLSCG